MSSYQAMKQALALMPEKERTKLIRSVARAAVQQMEAAQRFTIEDTVLELRRRYPVDQDTALEAVFLASMYMAEVGRESVNSVTVG